MIPGVPRPERLPHVPGTDLEKTFDGYIAACESCGQDCWWVAKDPHGTCPCEQPDDLTEAAA